jgi:formylglycine-generating enzyme required for sulfatase activity
VTGGSIHAARRPDRPKTRRLVRGGSWNNNPRNLRSAKVVSQIVV